MNQAKHSTLGAVAYIILLVVIWFVLLVVTFLFEHLAGLGLHSGQWSDVVRMGEIGVTGWLAAMVVVKVRGQSRGDGHAPS